MMSRPTLILSVAIALLAAPRHGTFGAEDELPAFRSLFDGKTLDGWSAPDMRYWSVEDGAIVARSSAELPCTTNQFLVWKLGSLDDFELELEFRISGDASANSGIQIRSAIAEDGHAVGYQADLDLAGQWRGALYDEHGRAILARPGQRTRVGPDGHVAVEGRFEPAPFHADDWNRYRIVARGPRITIEVNGKTTADVVDEQETERDFTGHLALQLHSGPPATVAFREIRLRRLPLDGGRKKVVLLAGAPSHPCGQHEFNAGIALLTPRLAAVEGIVAAAYHDRGWPTDPSAFDNANAIVLYSDGGGGHPLRPHREELDALMARGVGLMCMHYAVEIPAGEDGKAFQRWIGGYYESGYSSNPHWSADLRVNAEHPIGRGVRGETIHDEWYFCMRFREDLEGVETILSAKPSDETRSMNGYPRKSYPHILAMKGREETLLWAVERADGGRGVGFTGGHWHRNWAWDAQRRVILNAMVWVAGGEVPQGGVDSREVTREELNANLDPKPNPVEIELPE